MGCMLFVASCSKWLLKDIFGINDHAGEQAPITDEEPGERSPRNDTNVSP